VILYRLKSTDFNSCFKNQCEAIEMFCVTEYRRTVEKKKNAILDLAVVVHQFAPWNQFFHQRFYLVLLTLQLDIDA